MTAPNNMSEQPKKTRDIKDLKSRLGRGPTSGAPGGVPAPASGIPAPLPMQGGAPAPGIPRPMDVPAPFGPPGGLPAGSGRPPADPFAAPQARGPASVPPGAMRASAAPYAAPSAD